MAIKDDKGYLHAESNGQFISKDEQDAKREEAERIYDTDSGAIAPQGDDSYEQEKSSSIDGLLGEEFKGYKGQAAIDKLLQEKRGYVKGAFHRDDIGDIDLLWGNDNLGLQHIVRRRQDQGIDAGNFLQDITDVIQSGNFRKKNDRGNFEFMKNGKIAVISPELWGNKITFLLTAFKTHSKK